MHSGGKNLHLGEKSVGLSNYLKSVLFKVSKVSSVQIFKNNLHKKKWGILGRGRGSGFFFFHIHIT